MKSSEGMEVDPSISRIAIVGGTGAEGRGLALRFAQAGVAVTVASRVQDRAREAARDLKQAGEALTIDGDDNGSAIAQADVVLLTVPFAHAAGIVEEHRGRFRAGALLIDVTVPVSFEGGRPRMVDVAEGSAAEHLRARIRADVAVAAAFKTLPASFLARIDQPLDCDEFVCGDSPETRQRTLAVVGRIPGLRPIDAGPLEATRIIERMTLLAIQINRRYKSHDARFRLVGI
jgi:NADPH-dependent F420 reductase